METTQEFQEVPETDQASFSKVTEAARTAQGTEVSQTI